MSPLEVTGQAEWNGGIYRGRRAPAGAVYDAVNAFLNGEGYLARRGGSIYKTAVDAGGPLVGLASMTLPTRGATLLAWSTENLWVYDPAAGLVSITTVLIPRPFARGVGVADKWYVPPTAPSATLGVVEVADGGFAPPVVSGKALAALPEGAEYLAAVGSPARLIATRRNRAYFSVAGDAANITAESYHELPLNAQIIGADSIEDTAVLFTTAGVYVIENMAFDPVDDAGNVQHRVAQINKDLILWGDPGMASYRGALVVPGIDDVYLFTVGGDLQPITGGRGRPDDDGIRDLYRRYVKAGYQPGLATVHRGHYWLPVLSGLTVVDVLVCQLDQGQAWTRWSGHAAGGAYVAPRGDPSRRPELLSIHDARITDLSSTLDPATANAADADGSEHSCTIITRDYPTSASNHPGTVARARLRYELLAGSQTFVLMPDGPLEPPWVGWTGPLVTVRDGRAYSAADYADASRPEVLGATGYCEAIFERPLTLADTDSLGVGVEDPHATPDGVRFEIKRNPSGTGFLPTLYSRWLTSTLAVGATVTSSQIDGIRLTVAGAEVRGFFRIAGAWTQVVSATDARLAGPNRAPVAAQAGYHVPLSTVSGTIDGVPINVGTRVLLHGQSNPAQNGIYSVMGPSGMGRTSDMNAWDELVGAVVTVTGGARPGETVRCTAGPGGTLGTTPVGWDRVDNRMQPGFWAWGGPEGSTVGIVAVSWGTEPPSGAGPVALELAYSSDQDGDAFTTLPGAGREASPAPGGAPSDGSYYSWWPVSKQRERIRFRITQTGAAGSFVLRTLELLVRQSGLR